MRLLYPFCQGLFTISFVLPYLEFGYIWHVLFAHLVSVCDVVHTHRTVLFIILSGSVCHVYPLAPSPTKPFRPNGIYPLHASFRLVVCRPRKNILIVCREGPSTPLDWGLSCLIAPCMIIENIKLSTMTQKHLLHGSFTEVDLRGY